MLSLLWLALACSWVALAGGTDDGLAAVGLFQSPSGGGVYARRLRIQYNSSNALHSVGAMSDKAVPAPDSGGGSLIGHATLRECSARHPVIVQGNCLVVTLAVRDATSRLPLLLDLPHWLVYLTGGC